MRPMLVFGVACTALFVLGGVLLVAKLTVAILERGF